MAIEKPQPLMVGDKAYFSLTSYDPVEISVEVPYTSDEEVEYALQMTVMRLGGTPESLSDPTWLAEHFEGTSDLGEIRAAIRVQLNATNAQIAEEQKPSKCVEQLAARLMQSVPPQHIAQARQMLQMQFEDSLEAEGSTPAEFMATTGTTQIQLEAMFDRQARDMAEGSAALEAYAREKKLKVDEHEYANLLGLSPEDAESLIEQARAAGQSESLRSAALRNKAAQIVVAECSCTYEHETPEQARARVAEYRRMQEMLSAAEKNAGAEETGSKGSSGFKLV